MNIYRICVMTMLVMSGAVLAWSAPYIGYAYPAGGQQGTVVRINVGGLGIHGVKGVDITGAGVSATFVRYEGAGGPLNRAQRDLLKQRIKELIEKLMPTPPPQPKATPAVPPATTPTTTANPVATPAAPTAKPATPSATPAAPTAAPANHVELYKGQPLFVAAPATPAATPTTPATPAATPATPATPAVTPTTPAVTPATPAANPATPAVTPAPPVTLPDLPDLQNLDQLTVKQLRKIANKYLNREKRVKEPIAEDATVDITIAADALPGDRELRLITSSGMTNPLIFQVGKSPEVREKDREDEESEAPPPTEAPVVLNGQIMPGEVTTFALKLHAGQKLVFSADARHLIPYLADAVPGWFQAVLALYDAQGKEVGYADDNSFDPDPSFCYQVPQDGDYALKIYDALYRGREDFVYRINIREQTAGESPYPFASLGKVTPDGVPAEVNPLLPFVDSQLPQCDEIKPNTTLASAQKIAWPQLIKGCIAHPGDTGFYRFTGKTGDMVAAEVYARRLGSPMSSLLRVRDATGHVLAWNDGYKDAELPEMGLLTVQADAYLLCKLPADGVYYVQVSDALQHGGEAYQYYLRIGPPQADFVLRSTPSTVNIRAGSAAVITVYAYRKDGWNGDIELALKDAPDGFSLGNAHIPAGLDHAKITLNVPKKKSDDPFNLHLEGHAVIDGKTVIRPVIAADQKMQAFAYNHLVPSQVLLVWVHK